MDSNLALMEKLLADDTFVPFLSRVDWSVALHCSSRNWSLTGLVNTFGIAMPRDWLVLNLRYGTTPRPTLEEVASEHLDGVSRERVRQIEARLLDRVRSSLLSVDLYLDLVESHAASILAAWTRSDPIGDSDLAVGLTDMGWEDATTSCAGRLLTIVRALLVGGADPPHLMRRYPALCRIACHEGVGSSERAGGQRCTPTRKLTYVEIAATVLRQVERPLHYRDIAKRANDGKLSSDCKALSLLNAVYASPRFVRTGQGIYDLVDHTPPNVRYEPDDVFSVLLQADYPLSVSEILALVSDCAITRTRLMTILASNPRFYRSENGCYGIRARLPVRVPRRFDVPDYLQETAMSRGRLARAIADGSWSAAELRKDQLAVDKDRGHDGDGAK